MVPVKLPESREARDSPRAGSRLRTAVVGSSIRPLRSAETGTGRELAACWTHIIASFSTASSFLGATASMLTYCRLGLVLVAGCNRNRRRLPRSLYRKETGTLGVIGHNGRCSGITHVISAPVGHQAGPVAQNEAIRGRCTGVQNP